MAYNERPRITGIENEWSIVYDDPRNKTKLIPISSPHIETLINKHAPQHLSMSKNGMLSNGARLYKEPLGFVEYAGAEEASLEGAVASDIASERIVAAMAHSAIQAGDLPPSSRINKRVVADHTPEYDLIPTWGYHVSFAADAERLTQTEDRQLPLALHLATMNIYAGAGMLRHFGEDTTFAIGQKALNLNCTFATDSHGSSQPLVSTRGEHHAASSKHLRLHITSMDPHISPWATKISIGTTSIIIRLMESGYLANEIASGSPTQPYVIAREVARDTTLSATFALAGDRTMSALDIQNYLYEKATHLDLPAEEAAIMHEWRRALDTLARNPLELVEADWVMRYKLITNKIEKAGVGLDSKIARYWNDQYDLTYEYSTPDTNPQLKIPIIELLRTRSAMAKYTPPQELIESRLKTPPPDTRAHVRGRLIAKHIGKAGFQADWSRVRYTDNDQVIHEFDLLNPYDNKNENEILQPINGYGAF